MTHPDTCRITHQLHRPHMLFYPISYTMLFPTVLLNYKLIMKSMYLYLKKLIAQVGKLKSKIINNYKIKITKYEI